MTSSSGVDAATEALIAQLMAEDLGESYYRHSTPIGASYHDYEEPLSSYERQCLDAENNPDEEGEEGSGWGPEDSDEVSGAVAPDEGLYPTGPTNEGTWDSANENWDSRYVDEDGQVQEHTASGQSPQAAGANEDDNHSDSNSCSSPTNEELTGAPSRVVSPPAYDVPNNPADETHNISAPMTLPTLSTPGVPDGHLDPSDHSSHREPFIPSFHLAPNEWLPASSGLEVEGQWDDGLDCSSSKGKGKAVRAYDEFKRGLRDGEKESWDPNIADLEHRRAEDADSDSEEEGEVRDEDIPFISIPWPCAENDELLSRREDAEVVEIRVGDDETLESILRDISLRDERRQKGKGVEGRIECADEDVPGRKDVAAWW